MHVILNCRLCKKDKLTDLVALGEQYITSCFPMYNDFSTPKISVTLCKCEFCHLLQLREIINLNELYEQEYGYKSRINTTMNKHLLF